MADDYFSRSRASDDNRLRIGSSSGAASCHDVAAIHSAFGAGGSKRYDAFIFNTPMA